MLLTCPNELCKTQLSCTCLLPVCSPCFASYQISICSSDARYIRGASCRQTFAVMSVGTNDQPRFLHPSPKAAYKLSTRMISMAKQSFIASTPFRHQLSVKASDAMALNYSILFLVLAVSAPLAVLAGDPDILTDFIVPPNTNVDGRFFTYTGLRNMMNMSQPPQTFMVMKATMMEFPALNGQSVSYAMLMYPAGSVNPPHTHPRSAELLLVVDGSLSVGFVDTTNKLYTQDLNVGDMFVFPKGLVHYQFNQGPKPATALSGFGSAAAGTVSVPLTVFNTSIDDNILAKSFKTDVPTIQKLKAGFAPPKMA